MQTYKFCVLQQVKILKESSLFVAISLERKFCINPYHFFILNCYIMFLYSFPIISIYIDFMLLLNFLTFFKFLWLGVCLC
jgi:hypothetical protein